MITPPVPDPEKNSVAGGCFSERILFAAGSTRAALDTFSEATGLSPVSLLSAPEKARQQQLSSPGARDDFIAARVLARALLASWTGAGRGWGALRDFDIQQFCDACHGPHGRPLVQGLPAELSWAHAGGFVAAGVGPARLGVDIEPARGAGPDGTPVASWVRGEAVLKWGHGVIDDVAGWAWALIGPPQPHGRPLWLGTTGTLHRSRPWLRGTTRIVVTDAPTNDDYVCSVAGADVATLVEPLATLTRD